MRSGSDHCIPGDWSFSGIKRRHSVRGGPDVIAAPDQAAREAATFLRLNRIDFATKQLRPGEANAAVQVEQLLGNQLVRNGGEGADFIFSTGPKAGESLDMLFAIRGGNIRSINAFNSNFASNFNRTCESIIDHLIRYDNVALDMRDLTAANRRMVENFLKTLPTSLTQKIIFIRL